MQCLEQQASLEIVILITVKNSDPKTLIGAHTIAYEMNILLKLTCEQNRNIEHAEFVVVLKSREISFAIDTSVI